VPQLLASVWMFVQTPLQAVGVAPLQAELAKHSLPAQIWPPSAAHSTEHPPQLLGSEVVSTQVPPQAVPLEQLMTHWPLSQTSPPVQAALQAPQLLGSEAVVTHEVPHRFWPDGQFG
jgi:hypothetical protein